MADAGNGPKPTSSVKLVLLGEAAVGKVSQRIATPDDPIVSNLVNTVFSRSSIRQQRLPGE